MLVTLGVLSEEVLLRLSATVSVESSVQLKPVLPERNKMEFWLHTVLVLAVSTAAVMGFPNGASIDACDNGLMPNHPSPPNMAVGDSPFYVNTSNIGDYYIPEETYTIVLSGTSDNMDFRGFLIQARIVADGSPVGQFMTDGSSDQQTRCINNTAATHTLNNEKTMVELTWIAPMEETGPILFRFTFVDRYSSSNNLNVFFGGIETDMIGEGNATATSPTTPPTSSPTTQPPEDNGSTGLIAGTVLILLLSAIITLIN